MRLWNPVEDTLASPPGVRAGELTPTAWVRSLLHRQHLPLLSLSDPAPSIAGLGVVAGKAWLRLRGKIFADEHRRVQRRSPATTQGRREPPARVAHPERVQ